MRYVLPTVLVLALLGSSMSAGYAEEAAAVRDEIDVALDTSPLGTLERSDPDLTMDPELWSIGGRRRADGTCCPPPPPPVLREDPCTPLDPCAPVDCCVSPFSVTLGLGLSLAQGNSDSFDLAFSGEAKYDRKPWLMRLRWLIAYGENNGIESTNAQHGDVRAERRSSPRWTTFANLSFDSDKLAGLQYRWIGTVGMGYFFLERKGTYLKGEAGLGWTLEKRRFRVETNDPSGYAGVEYLRKFRNGIDLTAGARFFPNFGEFDLSLIVFQAGLAVPLSETFSIALALRVDHVIEAPAPSKDTDVLFTAGVQVKL